MFKQKERHYQKYVLLLWKESDFYNDYIHFIYHCPLIF